MPVFNAWIQPCRINTESLIYMQIETIGDAYCVASGLHRASQLHAQQIAWMALKMMETTHQHQAHDGNAIRVR